jgi:hypothetical protein
MSSSTVFQVRFWCRFSMWSCLQTHRHKTVHGWITNDCNLTRESCTSHNKSAVWQDVHKIPLYTEHPAHTSHSSSNPFTCQGRKHSRTKRRVESSAVRSAPTHKPTHQSQYSVHDSLLQLLKTNGIMSSSTVFQVRVWCRSLSGHVSRHTDTKPSTDESQTTVI